MKQSDEIDRLFRKSVNGFMTKLIDINTSREHLCHSYNLGESCVLSKSICCPFLLYSRAKSIQYPIDFVYRFANNFESQLSLNLWLKVNFVIHMPPEILIKFTNIRCCCCSINRCSSINIREWILI